MLFPVGWTITDTDETAIAALPETAWTDSLRQDGEATDTAGAAELTGANPRAAGWIPGLRLIARRTHPAGRHKAKFITHARRRWLTINATWPWAKVPVVVRGAQLDVHVG